MDDGRYSAGRLPQQISRRVERIMSASTRRLALLCSPSSSQRRIIVKAEKKVQREENIEHRTNEARKKGRRRKERKKGAMLNAAWDVAAVSDPTDWPEPWHLIRGLDSSLRCELCFVSAAFSSSSS